MDMDVQPTWQGLLQAENLAELSQHCAAAALMLLGEDRFGASWLLLHDVSGTPPWWILLPTSKRRPRFYLECPIKQLSTAMGDHVSCFPSPPLDLFTDTGLSRLEESELPKTQPSQVQT